MIVRRVAFLITISVALAAGSAPASAITTTTLKAKLAKEMRHAGGLSGAYVREVDSGRTLFSWRADARRVPASVEKLYTTASSLLLDGPAFTLPTTAVAATEPDDDGVVDGGLYVVGSGDPQLTTSGLARLARAVKAAGVRRVDRVYGDDDAWDRRVGGPDSGYRYDYYLGGQLGALAVNRGWEGRRLQGDPADYAARKLTVALRKEGVKVGRVGGRRSAPDRGVEVASVASKPLRDLARATNVPSDNYLAEMLLKGLGDRHGVLGTTGAGAAVARDALKEFGINPKIVDGSGLSRANRTSPRQVVRLLEGMAEQDSGPDFRASLARAGRTGTLKRRMRGTPASGKCRAKTGTLNGVSALAGYCPARDGGDVAFAILMSRVGIFTAHGVQDRMAAAITRWDG